tara:strand:- start:1103 stop:1312 length:210 start_codon:yes stop_codon:yes gene_type:complete
MKYKIDEWVIFKPFPNDKNEILYSIKNRAVILHVYKKEEYYDYEVWVDDSHKIKKVHEHQLFPDAPPTY